jgi:hypothetical protein
MAAGVLKQKLVHDEVLETTTRVKERFVRLLSALVEAIGCGRTGEAPPDEPGVGGRPATHRKGSRKR